MSRSIRGRTTYLLLVALSTIILASVSSAEPRTRGEKASAPVGALEPYPEPIDVYLPEVPVHTPLSDGDYFLWTEHGGWWYDAEKTEDNEDDNRMCWAAAASNLLEWSGWGVVTDPVNGLLEDSDAMFQNFNYYWVDAGGNMHDGFAWWFDGTYCGRLEYGHEDSGGYHVETFTPYYMEDEDNPLMLPRIDDMLHRGYAVSLGIAPVGSLGSHAITCWGYRCDPSKDKVTQAEEYYLGIWVTDSDDNRGSDADDPPPNTLRYYTVTYNVERNFWEMPTYDTGFFIFGAFGLSRMPGETRPVAKLGGPYTGTEGAPLTFSGEGSTGDAVLRYRWDLDEDNLWDTDFSWSPTASRTWADEHRGAVYLEVYDGVLKDVEYTAITVLNVAPDAHAGADRTLIKGVAAGFQGAFTDPGWLDTHTAAWDWGDGSTGPGAVSEDEGAGTATASHTYTSVGIYTATLTVTDCDGGIGVDSLTVTVINPAPVVEAGPDRAAYEGAQVSFSGSFTDPDDTGHTITWDFGDKATASGTLTPTHTYADDGVYTVTLTVTDGDGGVGRDTLTVTVVNVPPEVEAGQDQSVYEGVLVSFSGGFADPGSGDRLHTREWDFGDGSPRVGGTLTPSHAYGDDGVYTVTLRVTDDDGGVGADTLTVTVNNVAPTLGSLMSGRPNPYFVLPGQLIRFTAPFMDPGWLDTHTGAWDWGDASMDAAALSEENAEPDATGTCTGAHTYRAPGRYTVTLRVTDDDGGSDMESMRVTVASAEEAVQMIGDYLRGLPASAFRGADNNRKTLSNLLKAVLRTLSRENHKAAIIQLEAIRRIVDGRPSWITDPAARRDICMMIDDLVAYLRTLK